MSLLRFLHRDRFNMIDILTAIIVVGFMPTNGWNAVVFFVASLTLNIVAGVLIRWSDR